MQTLKCDFCGREIPTSSAVRIPMPLDPYPAATFCCKRAACRDKAMQTQRLEFRDQEQREALHAEESGRVR